MDIGAVYCHWLLVAVSVPYSFTLPNPDLQWQPISLEKWTQKCLSENQRIMGVAGGMVHMVAERLPSKWTALSSNSSTAMRAVRMRTKDKNMAGPLLCVKY